MREGQHLRERDQHSRASFSDSTSTNHICERGTIVRGATFGRNSGNIREPASQTARPRTISARRVHIHEPYPRASFSDSMPRNISARRVHEPYRRDGISICDRIRVWCSSGLCIFTLCALTEKEKNKHPGRLVAVLMTIFP